MVTRQAHVITVQCIWHLLLQSVGALDFTRVLLPLVNRQLSESFRWGAEALAGSLVNVLTMRVEKAFDTSWVEATLRLYDIGVQALVQCRFTDQLYADDLVLVADSPLDLQTALNAAHRWECRFRFRFGVGPTKSAMMVFGPRRRLADCDLHLVG